MYRTDHCHDVHGPPAAKNCGPDSLLVPLCPQRDMTAIDQEPMFLRPVEAAKLAGLSTRAIYRAIQRGELRAVRLCSRLRIPREGFDEWIARSAVRSEPRVVEVRAIPAARGSFRRLLGGDQRGTVS
jgi:excisionase family DNA binding protein